MQRATKMAALGLVMSLVFASCEKPSHENIDKWLRTEKGPSKLKKTLRDSSVDADLAAHAAINLTKLGKDAEVVADIGEMSVARKDAVLAKLLPRLWNAARVEGEMSQPSPAQASAKDLLFDLRKMTEGELRKQLDGYLVDWYTSGYYEGRATFGNHGGAVVMRALGPSAGEKLMAAANAIVAKPLGDGKRLKIGDELLLGMAASGSPDAVKYVLDIVRINRGDATQGARALSALYTAYVEPRGAFDLVDPAPLVPNLEKLAEIAKDSTVAPRMTNDAIALIRAVGMPGCLAPLVSLIRQLHTAPQFRYVGANNALKCGGVAAISDVVAALPDGQYQNEELRGAVTGEIAKMAPRDAVLKAVRDLARQPRTLARWIAAEIIFAMKAKDASDVLQALAADKTKLAGYFGDEPTPVPTLSARVAAIQKALAEAP